MSSDKDDPMVSNDFYLYKNKLVVACFAFGLFFDCNEFNSLFMFGNQWFEFILKLIKGRNTIIIYKLQHVIKMELVTI